MSECHITRQLAIFALRSFELADRVAVGELELIDGVDMALEAARWSGLTERTATTPCRLFWLRLSLEPSDERGRIPNR
jgi:hypothetical protein